MAMEWKWKDPSGGRSLPLTPALHRPFSSLGRSAKPDFTQFNQRLRALTLRTTSTTPSAKLRDLFGASQVFVLPLESKDEHEAQEWAPHDSQRSKRRRTIMDEGHALGSSSALGLAIEQIFADAVYNTEVLNLEEGTTEAALQSEIDQQLAAVNNDAIRKDHSLVQAYPTSTTASTTTTEPRSVGSRDTLGSESTAVTSNNSRSSREHDQPSSPRGLWKRGISISSTYDRVREGFMSRVSTSTASLPVGLSNTAFSAERPKTASAQEKSSPVRALSRAASVMNLNDSILLSSRPRPPKRNATDQPGTAPLPRSSLSGPRTFTLSVSKLRRGFSSTKSPSVDVHELKDPSDRESELGSPMDPLNPYDLNHADPEIQQKLRTSFSLLRRQIDDELRRFEAFRKKQLTALELVHRCLQETSIQKHEEQKAAMLEAHATSLQTLEELQLTIEMELGDEQIRKSKEARGALRIMEAACANSDRTVTQEDRLTLDKQRRLVADIDRLHESQITVLRGRQERKQKERAQKLKVELDNLLAAHAKELGHDDDMEVLKALIRQRKKALIERSKMRVELWRKEFENEHHTVLNGCYTQGLDDEEFCDTPSEHLSSVLDKTSELLKATSRKAVRASQMLTGLSITPPSPTNLLSVSTPSPTTSLSPAPPLTAITETTTSTTAVTAVAEFSF
ncbi:hypothetical protein K402DRAFT_416004 [Aulographum hederae CBS 113979]|uniref:Uncharacterized protein n=1 Tax=Aulographum hederae CBS 113979 TaxID=1176131 RepID=A0A6G1HH27_9PEZI|nr:hypothetical protein K402DRAFT_416004 [Aulographum hederae CBS 113979]